MKNIVFWDVDTQVDFMTPPEQGGRLYVKNPNDANDAGAMRIVPELERLSSYARVHGILRVATGDWHTLEHGEIDAENPDFRTTYPPHCMADETGSQKIPETRLRDPVVVPLGAADDEARSAVRTARGSGRDIWIHKEEFSCFTGNAATEALIEELDSDAFVVYGVALDVCVKAAVEGMLDRGKQVWVVEDATWGLGLEDKEQLLARWAARGARRVRTDDILSGTAPSADATGG